MEKSIFEKIEEYLKTQQEMGGDTVYFSKDLIVNSIQKEETQEMAKKTVKEKVTEPEVPKVAVPIVNEEWKSCSSLPELYDKIHDCLNCELGNTRKNFVFGTGNPNADIFVIGEAPGADEDEQGLPFVGRAGQLLTKILESINLSRDEVFIGNIIKCRPPNNRVPKAEEVEQCEPYLIKQLELIKPAFILALGKTAIDTLLKANHKMGEMRGKILDYQGIKLLVTYHPAALLRNPEWKKSVWEDVKNLRRMYDEYLQNK